MTSTDPQGFLATLALMAFKEGASDIHLESGGDAYYRVDGELEQFPSGMDPDLVQMALDETWPGITTEVRRLGSVDCSGTLGGVRVRANVSDTHAGMSAVFRIIPDEIPTLAQLGVPDSIRSMVDCPNGLILATGEFGSGKTTILASLIDDWNARRTGHILCLEEPMEFLHRPKRARISQREIPKHARTWAEGIRAARRSDPDIVMIGELRDPEGVVAAMAAASSGILVLATLHAGSTAQALTALLAMAPDNRRAMVQTQLAQALRGVVTQQLLPAVGGGRVAAREVMTGTDTLRGLVMRGDFTHLESTVSDSREDGMWLMALDLARLVVAGRITPETAHEHYHDDDLLDRKISSERSIAARKGAR